MRETPDFGSADDTCSDWYCDDSPDPWPDDPEYEAYLVEKARTDRLARRVFRCRPSTRRKATGPRLCARPSRSIRRLSRGRHRRAHRGRRVVRSAASGDGNSPSRHYQYCSHRGNKRRKEHRTACFLSGYQEGGHHG